MGLGLSVDASGGMGVPWAFCTGQISNMVCMHRTGSLKSGRNHVDNLMVKGQIISNQIESIGYVTWRSNFSYYYDTDDSWWTAIMTLLTVNERQVTFNSVKNPFSEEIDCSFAYSVPLNLIIVDICILQTLNNWRLEFDYLSCCCNGLLTLESH